MTGEPREQTHVGSQAIGVMARVCALDAMTMIVLLVRVFLCSSPDCLCITSTRAM